MHHVLPTLVVSQPDAMRATALKLLDGQSTATLLRRIDSTKNATALLSRIDCIFSDIDGTLTQEGATVLPPRSIDYFGLLRNVGVSVTLVSGKPYEEILPLMQSLPAGLGVSAIYEKGAFRLDMDSDGTWLTTYVLDDHDLERAAAELRRRMPDLWADLRAAHAKDRISFGWAGSGKHRSLLSIDVFAGDVPADYMQLTGADRDKLKLKNTTLLAALETEIREFIDAHYPNWGVIHLGNANFEITPPGIEKDIAVQQTPEFQKARGVLVIGDSGNDRKMLALRRHDKVAAALVLHNEAMAELTEAVDFITVGLANPYPLFDCLLAAKLSQN